jgi:hypothetical protein
VEGVPLILLAFNMELLPGEQKQAQNVQRLYTEKVSMGILLNIPLGDGRLETKTYKGKNMQKWL